MNVGVICCLLFWCGPVTAALIVTLQRHDGVDGFQPTRACPTCGRRGLDEELQGYASSLVPSYSYPGDEVFAFVIVKCEAAHPLIDVAVEFQAARSEKNILLNPIVGMPFARPSLLLSGG